MKALTAARYLGQDGAWFSFGLAFGVEARIAFLERDIARVVFRRDGGYRLDRGWSIAPNRLEPAFSGRKREDLTGHALPPAIVAITADGVEIAAGDLVLKVRLSPFGLNWHRRFESVPFLCDRATQAYLVSRRSGAFSHFVSRDRLDRHYGLGDKSGALDKTGRRFRIDAVDPCGYDAESSDPLY